MALYTLNFEDKRATVYITTGHHVHLVPGRVVTKVAGRVGSSGSGQSSVVSGKASWILVRSWRRVK